MRILAVIAFSFGVGTLAAALIPSHGWLVWTALALLAAAIPVLLLRKRAAWTLLCGIISLSLASSLLYFAGYQRLVQQPVLARCGQEAAFSGVVCADPVETEHGAKVTLLLRQFPRVKAVLYGEAELLSLIDLVDSRMEIYAEALQELPEGTFSGRIFALDKKIYRHH